MGVGSGEVPRQKSKVQIFCEDLFGVGVGLFKVQIFCEDLFGWNCSLLLMVFKS